MLPLGIIPTIITLPVLADVLTGCGHPRVGHPSQENYQDAIFLATQKIWALVQKILTKIPSSISEFWTRPQEGSGQPWSGDKDDFLGYWVEM